MDNDRRKWLYENGIVADAEVVITSNYLILTLEILFSLFTYPHYQRRLTYKFMTKDGKEYFGDDYVKVFFEPKKFFAMKNFKISILYAQHDPKINLIYTEKESKKYNYK